MFCPWEPPIYLLYSADVPAVLYYAYIPIVLISLFAGSYILIKDKFSLLSKLFSLISLSFAVWIVNILFQWTSNDALVQMFSWQMTAILEIPIFLLSLYFVMVFYSGKDISFSKKLLLFAFGLPVILLLPTQFNVSSFYLTSDDCGGNNGPLWLYVYAFEIFSILWILAMCGKKILKENLAPTVKHQIVVFTLGAVLFLGIFSASNILGEITQVYEINLIGPIGMVLFLSFLSYIIVRFKTFSVKILGTQVLVVAIWALTGSLLFINNLFYIHAAIGVTFVALLPVGISLVRSVKREVALREELQRANKRQQETMRFITHEVKGYLTDGAAALDALGTGSFGPMTPDMKTMVSAALTKNRAAIREIQNFLRIADFKTGKMSYVVETFDMSEMLRTSLSGPQEHALSKGLVFSIDVVPGTYTFTGDKDQIMNHVVINLANNAVNYTPSGSIAIKLEQVGTTIRLSITDTGVGLSDEDKSVLFTEGGHGKNSRAINPHSTGYGLFIAKQIVEGHQGTISAESAGKGTGSTFVVELPTTLTAQDFKR